MSELICPFYQNSVCILKSQCNLPDFKKDHDCQSLLNKCSFFAKEKVKQIEVNSKIKIFIKQVSNVYLVKADALVYPINNLLEIDDPLLNRMTDNQLQKECDKLFQKGVKTGYPYSVKTKPNWKNKQKYIINAVIAVESRLVNEADIASAMKKSLLLADQMGLQNLIFMPCDNGTHDINLTSLSQLSAIFTLCQTHEFKSLKSVYICMVDEESEISFIEYYNRIFGGTP